MPFTSRDHRKTPLAVKLSLAVCVLLGILLFTLSALKLGQSIQPKGFLPDLAKDVGMGLLVSSIVGGLFEIYRSTRHEIETMKDVIDFVMGDRITPAIWMELKGLIEKREVIRRDFHLRLEFEPSTELEPHQRILKVDLEYDIESLLDAGARATVLHELDYQFQNRKLDLPRWDTISIRPNEARVKPREKLDLKKARQEIEVNLPPRQSGGPPIRVRTARRELATVPGSYNLYTPEFTKKLHVTVSGCPDNVETQVWVAPHGENRATADTNNVWYYDQLLFPGQGIEIKFVDKTAAQMNGDSQATKSAAVGTT